MNRIKTMQANKEKIIAEFTKILTKIMEDREILKEQLDFFIEFEAIIKPFVKHDRYNSFEISNKKQQLQYMIATNTIIAKYSKDDKLIIDFTHNILFLTDEYIDDKANPLLTTKVIENIEANLESIKPANTIIQSDITQIKTSVPDNINKCFTSDKSNIPPAFAATQNKKKQEKKW